MVGASPSLAGQAPRRGQGKENACRWALPAGSSLQQAWRSLGAAVPSPRAASRARDSNGLILTRAAGWGTLAASGSARPAPHPLGSVAGDQIGVRSCLNTLG